MVVAELPARARRRRRTRRTRACIGLLTRARPRAALAGRAQPLRRPAAAARHADAPEELGQPAARAASVLDDAPRPRGRAGMRADAPAAAVLRLAPALTVALLLAPIAAGLLGTLLPALRLSSGARRQRALARSPGGSCSRRRASRPASRLTVSVGLAATALSLPARHRLLRARGRAAPAPGARARARAAPRDAACGGGDRLRLPDRAERLDRAARLARADRLGSAARPATSRAIRRAWPSSPASC